MHEKEHPNLVLVVAELIRELVGEDGVDDDEEDGRNHERKLTKENSLDLTRITGVLSN